MPTITGQEETPAEAISCKCGQAATAAEESLFTCSSLHDAVFAEINRILFQPPNPTNPTDPTDPTDPANLTDPACRTSHLASSVNSSYIDRAQGNRPANLPAVPSAILMGIIGFLCVSLVRDRKVWVSALVLIFVLGQVGVQALPGLAARLAHGKLNYHKKTMASAASLPSPEWHGGGELAANRHFIGLLHRLAGSPEDDGLTNHFLSGDRLWNRAGQWITALRGEQPYYRIPSSQPAILASRVEIPLVALLPVVNQDHYISCFSPAFIFSSISRAPPAIQI